MLVGRSTSARQILNLLYGAPGAKVKQADCDLAYAGDYAFV